MRYTLPVLIIGSLVGCAPPKKVECKIRNHTIRVMYNNVTLSHAKINMKKLAKDMTFSEDDVECNEVLTEDDKH